MDEDIPRFVWSLLEYGLSTPQPHQQMATICRVRHSSSNSSSSDGSSGSSSGMA